MEHLSELADAAHPLSTTAANLVKTGLPGMDQVECPSSVSDPNTKRTQYSNVCKSEVCPAVKICFGHRSHTWRRTALLKCGLQTGTERRSGSVGAFEGVLCGNGYRQPRRSVDHFNILHIKAPTFCGRRREFEHQLR